MYGIIHRAVRDLVIETAGTDAWAQLCASKGISSHIFEPMDSYSDEQTYGLIIATAEFIGRPLDEILFQFGVYWVKVTAPRDYGMIFHITGGDLFEFLEGLDAMHERIVLTFANLQMPYFSLERVDEATARLHYRSSRPGLAPFVLGLLDGLAQHFQADALVEHLERKADGADHDIYLITLRGEPA
jgi:hypothetical protein